MRILQVITLVSPDGAYGGPTRVAINQSAALRDAGHEVVIAAGTRGFERVPTDLDGVTARLFKAYFTIPGMGFAGLWSPGLHWWLGKHASDFDVVHVHAARDLVSLPAAILSRRGSGRLAIQTHGMIDPSTSLLARPVDHFLTRPVFRSAKFICYLTDQERMGLMSVGADPMKLRPLQNGVPRTTIVQHRASTEVLFLARLHKRKRPMDFVAAAALLVDRYPDWTFSLVGPDEGEGQRVRALIEATGSPRIRYEGALPPAATLERMRAAAIYALPSVDEPFPMSVLEAMSVGVPSIVTSSCGLSQSIETAGAGAAIAPGVAPLADALSTLMNSARLRTEAGARAARLVQEEFTLEAVRDRLLGYYEELA